jgi:hypothetical protein
VVGITVVVGLVAQPRSRYSSMVWVWWLEASMAEGWVSHSVWAWHRAVASLSQRGRKPGRTEQQPCRPTGQGFGRPAVRILDCGVVKTSTI